MHPPGGPNPFNFMSFGENLAKLYVGAWGTGAPSSGKSWIRHWNSSQGGSRINIRFCQIFHKKKNRMKLRKFWSLRSATGSIHRFPVSSTIIQAIAGLNTQLNIVETNTTGLVCALYLSKEVLNAIINNSFVIGKECLVCTRYHVLSFFLNCLCDTLNKNTFQ